MMTNLPLPRIKYIRFQYRLRMLFARLTKRNRQVYVTDRNDFYKRMWQNAAETLAADFIELSPGIWEIQRDGDCVRISGYKVPIDDPVILDIAGDKALCYHLLAPQGIPMPDSLYFKLDDFRQGIRFLEQQKGAVVVKPATGTSAGRGVTTQVDSSRKFFHAVALASIYGDDLMAEQMLQGELYRLLFLNGQLIHAARRTGVRITGNGSSNINELYSEYISQTANSEHAVASPMNTTDRDFQETLAAQNMSGSTIPAEGQTVLVKSLPPDVSGLPETIPNYNEDVTDRVCPAIVKSAQEAVQSLNILFAGVDIVALDPSRSLEESGGGIIEVNTTPGLHHHYNLLGSSTANPPAERVLAYLLERANSN